MAFCKDALCFFVCLIIIMTGLKLFFLLTVTHIIIIKTIPILFKDVFSSAAYPHAIAADCKIFDLFERDVRSNDMNKRTFHKKRKINKRVFISCLNKYKKATLIIM